MFWFCCAYCYWWTDFDRELADVGLLELIMDVVLLAGAAFAL